MRWSLRFFVLGVLAAGLIVGCGEEPVPNPVWKTMCDGFCGRAVQCISELPVGACVSICLSELGGVSCEGNEEALEACVADMDVMPCWAIDQGQLPQSCDDICLCQGAEDCDDGNPCTAGVCNEEDGSCGAVPVTDGVACAGDTGTCEQSRCVMACTETAIRTAVVAGGGPYVFDCDRPTTVTTQAEIVIDKDVILDGDGNLIVDADGHHRVFLVSSEFRPVVELHGLTVNGGNHADFGGGIRNFGTLTITDCTVSGNTANDGGGLSNSGILTLVNSTVSENSSGSGGGGLDNDGMLTVTNSTISENSAAKGWGLWNRATAILTDTTIERNTATVVGGGFEQGGAIHNASNLTLIGSTVSENVGDVGEPFSGAGIVNSGGELTMTNSTVSGNVGGGIQNSGKATIISCTIADNTGGSSGFQNDGRVSLRNSVIAGRCDGRASSEWNSEGGNVESPFDTCRLDDPSDQVNVTAEELNLGPLQDNHGPTFTHLPGSPSAAIDAVPDGACVDVEEMALTIDQRGEPRPKGPRCDSGAVEAEFDPMLCAGVDCDDGIDCTDDGICNPTNGLCEGGADAPRNTPCDQEGGKFCDGSGSCVECNDASQCNDRNECTVDSCNPASASCDHNTVPDDTGCAQGAGTCQQGVCIGEFACTEQGVRDAIAQGGGPHAFACTGLTTVVTAAEIVIDNDVILDGVGNLTVDGNGTHRVFSVPPGITAELRRFTVTGGGGPFVGAGIRNEGTLTVTNSAVTKNAAAAHSGGIYNEGILALVNTTVSDNTANPTGGGIYNEGSMSLTESTVSGNTALDAGGIQNSGGLSVSRSTISGNIAELGQIAGILHHSGTLMLTNSTVAQNIGVGIQSSGTLIATHSTISGNMSRAISGGAAMVTNTVIDGTCSSTLEVSGGGNIESPGDTCGFDRPSDQASVPTEQVNLGPLQNNGGPTLTRLPGLGSVAIDQVDCAESTDQRGVARPQGPMCDVGAVEVEAQP